MGMQVREILIEKSIRVSFAITTIKSLVRNLLRKPMSIKDIKLVERNLRYYWGYAYPTVRRIEISTNLTDKQYMDTLIHEILHVLYPKDSESKISKNASTIRYYLWKQGFRRLEKDNLNKD
jgi:hypothetical protein